MAADHYKDSRGKVHLRMNADNRFKIMQMTDLHFGESDDMDLKTQELIKNLIEKENPDYIAVTGDIVSG